MTLKEIELFFRALEISRTRSYLNAKEVDEELANIRKELEVEAVRQSAVLEAQRKYPRGSHA